MRLRTALLPLLLLIGAAAGFAWLVLAPAPAVRSGPLVVDIPAHEGLRGIVEQLSEAGVIRSRVAFLGLAVVRGSVRRLKAGEYEVPRDASTLDVLDLLESGHVRQHVILRAAGDERLRHALGVEGPSVEGYLFPDTYQFVRGMSIDEMLSRMVQRMRGKLTPELVARARARGLSVHQLLTLASIIEREAIEPGERRLISAVFWNRLRLDMPLQADPTVQYAVAKERRALTRADLASDNAYNTYVHRGLPPGPIASPGLAAIEAALDPAPVKFLYFVARDDRRHHFSTTVAEHNAAVVRYRLSRR